MRINGCLNEITLFKGLLRVVVGDGEKNPQKQQPEKLSKITAKFLCLWEMPLSIDWLPVR